MIRAVTSAMPRCCCRRSRALAGKRSTQPTDATPLRSGLVVAPLDRVRLVSTHVHAVNSPRKPYRHWTVREHGDKHADILAYTSKGLHRGLPDDDVVFVTICGNPGAPSFYDEFCASLFQASGRSIGVCSVGHAGHSRHAAQHKHRLYNLQDQVTHKVHVLEELVHERPHVRLVLCGHSVGAHICLEIMKALPAETVLQCVLLFPTVMHIGSTPNGRRLMPMFTYARGLVGAAAWLVSKLPLRVQRTIARWKVGADHQEAVVDLLHKTVAQNALYMAYHEMQEIRDVDHENLKRFQDKCVFYFTPLDEWAPPEQHDHIRATYPRAQVHMCDADIPHAFVLGHGGTMAEKVWKWMSPVLNAASPPPAQASSSVAPNGDGQGYEEVKAQCVDGPQPEQPAGGRAAVVSAEPAVDMGAIDVTVPASGQSASDEASASESESESEPDEGGPGYRATTPAAR